MKYCERCGKEIKKGHENPHGLCSNCLYNYILKKIDREFEKRKKPIIYEEKLSKKIINFIRYWLKKLFQ